MNTCVRLLHISETAERVLLEFGMWVEWPRLAMRFTQVTDGYLCLHVRIVEICWSHSAEIECVARPITYAFYTAMGIGYLHVRKCNCTTFLPHLFTTRS